MVGNHRKIQNQKQFFKDNRISWAALDAVTDGPSYLSQLGVLFLFLFVVCFFIYATKAKIPVVVEGQGRIVSSKPAIAVRSQNSFTIAEINVTEHDIVRRGQILVTAKESLSPESLELLRAMIKGLQKINELPDTSLCLNCRTLLKALSQFYLGIKAQGEMLTLLSSTNDQIRHLTNVVDAYNDIENASASSRAQIKNAERKLADIKRRRAQISRAREVEELEDFILQESSELEEKFRVAASQIREVRRSMKARTKELMERTDQIGKSYAVPAPIDGKVTNIKINSPGELILSGQEMLELIPSGSELIGLIDVLNKDIANIKIGDEVIVSFDSMPELDFGTVSGRILDVVSSESSSNNFKIKVSIPKLFLSNSTGEKPVLMGMTVKGRVVTRFESLAKSIYRALFRVKDNVKVKQ